MSRLPGERIFGVETEFGTYVADETLGTPEHAVEAIKDYVFSDLRLGALDLHARDEVFEPARSGGFLLNGGRLYIDAVGSHLEYATAECRSLKDLVANDRAGQRIIVRALKDLGLQEQVKVFNNSIDHFGGHTFGCHENYLVRADDQLLTEGVQLLYPFLVTRQIFAGVGRVGGHLLIADTRGPSRLDLHAHPIDYIWVSQVYGVVPDESIDFQLSQRADHIIKTIASRVRFNRALINPKWEHYYSHDGMTRLHLLFGESNQNEFAYALKIGTTLLVLDLLEEGLIPERLALENPLLALREVSRDPTCKATIDLRDGGSIRAIDLQREYLNLSLRYRGASDQVDWILTHWQHTLDGLEADPFQLGDRLDWVAKYNVLNLYREHFGMEWGVDALHSVDLEYHNIDPEQGLYYSAAEQSPVTRAVDDLDILDAMTTPPSDTRAAARARIIKRILDTRSRQYMIDWSGVALERSQYIDLSDPFDTYPELEI